MKKITYLVASILLMGVVLQMQQRKITCQVKISFDFRNAEPVVLQKVELSSMCFPMVNLILMHVHRAR
jgi:hypothetical protein